MNQGDCEGVTPFWRVIDRKQEKLVCANETLQTISRDPLCRRVHTVVLITTIVPTENSAKNWR